MLDFMRKALSDSKMVPSFGRTVSVPFLVSAWLVGTVQGVMLVVQGRDAMDEVWGLALIAAMLYGGSKGLHVAQLGMEKHAQVRKPKKAPASTE